MIQNSLLRPAKQSCGNPEIRLEAVNGFDFDSNDTQAYVDSINSYLKNAQDYITSSGYEMKVAIGLVFGEDSAAGAELTESSGTFYQSLYQQLQPLEKSLQDVMADITANGLIYRSSSWRTIIWGRYQRLHP